MGQGGAPYQQPGNRLLLQDNANLVEICLESGILGARLNGGSFVPIGVIGGADPEILQGLTSQAFGGASFASSFDELLANTLIGWSPLGPPAQDLTHGGGVWTCVNTNTTIAFKTIPTVANAAVTPWYLGGRFRLATAAGAGEAKGVSLDSGGGADMIRAGLNGAVSTAKFSFAVTKASVTVSALSTVNTDTTTFHAFRMWQDLVGNVWGAVDNETPVLVCLAASVPVVALCDRWGTYAAAGGALGLYVDYFYSAAMRTAT